MSPHSILVVGGTGLIGAAVAARLAERGDHVTIASRRAASDADPPLIAGLPRIAADYTRAEPQVADLARFDAVVMAAGQDIRHVPAGAEDEAFWTSVQRDGVPDLAARARRAGVGRFVQVGSYYHQLRPDLALTNSYVAARRDADERARALSGDGFAVITVNPPSIVGAVTDRARSGFARMAAALRGEGPAPAAWAPPGGTNYLSLRSLVQAICGALDRGEPGRAYLIGDENLSYREWFQRFVDLTGGTVPLPVIDAPHPLQPDRFIVQGRGRTLEYEPDAAEVALLGYDRGDTTRALAEILEAR